MTDTPQPDWSAVRADYEAGNGTVGAIAARHGVKSWAIYKQARRYAWRQRRPKRTARAAEPRPAVPERSSSDERDTLIARIYRALATNLELMENRMSTDDTSTSADTERDMRALGSLVRTVEKAKEMEADTAGAATPASHSRKPRTAAEADALRGELAQRIRKLRERNRP